jgi:Tfp pilus assembly protein PilO
MSTILVEAGGAATGAFSLSYLMAQARIPLEAWSRRRRWLAALLIAVLVFGVGAYGWIVADFCGVEASRVALTASTQRFADASRSLAQLPTLRRASAAMPVEPSHMRWSSADDVRIVSELAAQSGVSLQAVAPGAPAGATADGGRPLQITARTDFVHLMAFMRGLSHLPVLIVPVDMTVKHDAASLSVNATLRVFNTLRPAASTASTNAYDDASLDSDDEDVVFFDPFSHPQMRAGDNLPDSSSLRLVGLLRDLTHGLALLDTPDGATTVTSGQQLGAERVTRIDADGVTLANGGTTRMLALTEAS